MLFDRNSETMEVWVIAPIPPFLFGKHCISEFFACFAQKILLKNINLITFHVVRLRVERMISVLLKKETGWAICLVGR